MHRATMCGALALLLAGCSSGSSSDDDARADGGAPAHDAGMSAADAAPGAPDADTGPCTPGAASLRCQDSRTFTVCTDDTDFDGNPDGPPQTVAVGCTAFFRDVGDASCEPLDGTTNEAVCTMDDDGPCGVFTITGAVTTARCTTDDAVCLLDLEAANYVCTAGTGISCAATGEAFEPFCAGNLLVWRCADDGDGIGQPHVDDCTALGNGTCDAAAAKCTGIEQGGYCRAPEWTCAAGLKCQANTCVPE